MLRTAVRKLGVKEAELRSMLEKIETGFYLPSMTRQQKATKLKPLREALEAGEI